MDEKKIQSEMNKHLGNGKAFIHSEVTDNGTIANYISGDVMQILFNMYTLVCRISNLTGTTKMQVVKAIAGLVQYETPECKEFETVVTSFEPSQEQTIQELRLKIADLEERLKK